MLARRHGERVAKVVLLLALLALTLPTLTGLVDLNVDSEWQMGLQTAVHQHLHWGPQVLWTFGPLGYFQYPLLLYPREWAITVVVLLLLSILFVTVVGLFLQRLRVHLGWWVVVVGVLVVTRGVSSGIEVKLAICMLVFTALAADDRQPPNLATVCACLGGLAFALSGMIRGTELLVAEVTVPAIVVALIVAHRRLTAALFSGSCVIGFVVLWVVAGQWIGDIPMYLRGSWEISSGYSWQGGVLTPWAEVALSLLALLPIVALGVLAVLRRTLMLGLGALVALSWGVVTYKEGIVGEGAVHRVHFAVVLMVLLVLLAAAAASRSHRVAPIVAAAGTAFAWLFIAPSLSLTGFDWNTGPPGDGSPAAVVTAYRHYANLFVSADARIAEIAAARAHFRKQAGLAPATVTAMRSGPTLFDPIDTGNVWAYDIPWAPGPVLQNYAAYTPWLQDVDAATLTSRGRPAHVLLTADHLILDEWPQFQDSAAFRALLGNYHLSPSTLAEARPGVLLFDSGGSTLPAPECVRALAPARPGDVITIPPTPASSYLFVDVQPSLTGRLRAMLVRGAKLHVQVRAGGVWTPTHDVVIPSPSNGLFVGGLVTDNQQMFELLTGLARNPITAVRVSTEYPGDFGEPFTVSLRASC
ncbi:MAG: hypothetical protein M3019_06050 [Candidatus Dormibacteraeota bacterium]|nr:hypothetical protein [Candidatus Dormibacteraeota bacterium]